MDDSGCSPEFDLNFASYFVLVDDSGCSPEFDLNFASYFVLADYSGCSPEFDLNVDASFCQLRDLDYVRLTANLRCDCADLSALVAPV